MSDKMIAQIAINVSFGALYWFSSWIYHSDIGIYLGLGSIMGYLIVNYKK